MKIVVVDKDYGSVSDEKLKKLQADYARAGIACELAHFQSEDEIIAGCTGAAGILGTGNPPITARVLEALPELQLVQRFGIGVNSIDLDAATANKVAVLYMPNFCVEELATHAASMILALSRNTAYYDRHIRRGEWPKAQYFEPRNLGGLTLGLYGFGGSARPLYRILHEGFGTKVIACDPFISKEEQAKYDVEFVNFDTMLRRSDILSIHAPLTDETRHIFNADAFKKMKNDAMIINIARGGLIDERALCDALRDGEIRFAGLDVFEVEPLPQDSPLRGMDNVVLTCHSAFYGDTAQATQLKLAYELVTDALLQNTLNPRYVANKDVLPHMAGFQTK